MESEVKLFRLSLQEEISLTRNKIIQVFNKNLVDPNWSSEILEEFDTQVNSFVDSNQRMEYVRRAYLFIRRHPDMQDNLFSSH